VRQGLCEGERLRQDAIATEFEVSRNPVREALRPLEAEGVTSMIANRGAVVPALSLDEIKELFRNPRRAGVPDPASSPAQSDRCGF